jgi:hypothetical protein
VLARTAVEAEPLALDPQVLVARRQEDAPRLEAVALLGLDHRQRRAALEHLRQAAVLEPAAVEHRDQPQRSPGAEALEAVHSAWTPPAEAPRTTTSRRRRRATRARLRRAA